MVARCSGAGLGLLAFAISTIAGLLVRNPVEVTLSRSILALFVFCAVGFALGAIAQAVIGEYEQDQATKIRKQFRDGDRIDGGGAESSIEGVESRDGIRSVEGARPRPGV